MAIANVRRTEESVYADNSSGAYYKNSLNASAVSWGAIIAGAAAAAALSLILLMLGAGLGMSSVSPWAGEGISAAAFGLSTIIWLSVTQILASGMGGYLAGRLRNKWTGVQIDEVYFRDTAHGFLAWSVATLATAALLTSVVGSIVNSGTQAAATLAGGAASAAIATVDDSNNDSATNQLPYVVDSLFRSNNTTTAAESNASDTKPSQQTTPTLEVTRIILNALDEKALPANDVTYIGQLIARNAGLSQAEAEQRVNEMYVNMQQKMADAELAVKETAEKARQASFYASLWLFASLLMGAFSASLAATWGGRCRDA